MIGTKSFACTYILKSDFAFIEGMILKHDETDQAYSFRARPLMIFFI